VDIQYHHHYVQTLYSHGPMLTILLLRRIVFKLRL
jgi:hypothetical protein